MPCSRLIIGVGSPHGDDRFGWAVVDALVSMNLSEVECRKTSNATDIVSEIDSTKIIFVVDAGCGLHSAEPVLRIPYVDNRFVQEIPEVPVRSTHAFGLGETLQLARSLEKPLNHVVLWVGYAERFEPMSEMSSLTVKAVDECVAAMAKEITDARNVAR